MKNIPVEELLSSKGRIKILKILALTGELNITEIVRRASLNHGTAYAHLKFLEEVGLIEEKTFGRVKIYRLRDNERAKLLKEFIEAWERLNKPG